MADAELERTTITVDISNSPQHLVATGEIIKFDGFLKVYLEDTDDEPEDEEEGNKSLLPPLTIGQALALREMKGKETFTRPAPRYTEASLVKKLEELGIGRPSTYAPTISTIQKREYVVKESREGTSRNYVEMTIAGGKFKESGKTENTGAEKNKLFPTNIAMVVNDFLVEHFPNVIDFHFTAKVEKEFDEIAAGGQDWQDMIDGFYGKFHHSVEETEQVSRQDVNTSRLIGQHPTSGKNVYARLGRFGPLVQIGETEDEDKQFASLKKGQFIENVTMDDALELFKLPREVGFFEDKKMTAALGRFGPYIKHDNAFYSLQKGQDPMAITEVEAIDLIQAKREADANKHIKAFDENPEIQILNGRWGPYIKFGKNNFKIPKGKVAEELTYAETIEIIEAQPDAGKKKGKFPPKKK
jgi:DNA topoisomerase-1